MPETDGAKNLQDLYRRFDGVGGDRRLAWYGQCRAMGLSHEAAVYDTYTKFRGWCDEVWPQRGFELPT